MKILIENNQATKFVTDTTLGFTVSAISGLELKDYSPDILINLIDSEQGAKEAAKFRIKIEAEKLINSLQWRIDRANERTSLGASGETVADVLREREAIRRASNRLETELDSLTDIEARSIQFMVLNSDYPTVTTLSRLEFMRRFTDAERSTIRAVRDSGQSQDLLDFWELLQLSALINVTDTDTVLGVNMLEQQELIGSGRASEILGE